MTDEPEQARHSATTERQNRWMLAVVFAAIVAWSIIHATGASLHGRTAWAGVVVAASFAVYLGVWLALLAGKAKRRGRNE